VESSCETRFLPVGAEHLDTDRLQFRVWAPQRRKVALVVESPMSEAAAELDMKREDGGYFAVETSGAPGLLYRYRIDGDGQLYPDPASRFQPRGPSGPSQVIDARSFAWTDSHWPGVRPEGQVIYEMHVGTFTPEGTWAAATEQLPELARLGITLIELMPIAEFPGRFGWSYDGVALFAPSHLYGTPDDFRRFVDVAHALGIGVALDVVYNHFGLGECSIEQFADAYVSQKHKNDWGKAINFDGDDAGPVREFFLANIRHWVAEYHLDGVRIDATQAFEDDSPVHILGELVREARAAAGARSIIVIAESEPQDVRMLRDPARGGFGMDMAWNDDFHHTAMVRATGRSEAYYTDYRGRAQEFVASMKWGYLFQGQRYDWQKKPRGTPVLDLPACTFVNYLQNHDQLANSARCQRLHEITSPGRLRALTAVLLLGPGTPLLFQGQEFAASSPFCYFADPPTSMAADVVKGRHEFMSQFPSYLSEGVAEQTPAPCEPATAARCRLNFAERHTNAGIYALHADLIRLRRTDVCLRVQDRRQFECAVLTDDCFLARYFHNDCQRLMIVNFGKELHFSPAPEPLLAPPENMQWKILWSSEHPSYGGVGTPPLETDQNWRIPPECVVVLETANRPED
jgi:maltooligosyltrehalose trehalohydrolase